MAGNIRLENSLARADELIAVGNLSAALQLLHEAINSRWFSHNFSSLDAIMLKFVELCVEMRRGRLAKDGLHQYRNICQTSTTQGFETVLKHFLDVAEGRLKEVHDRLQKSGGITLDEGMVEDLEQGAESTLTDVWGASLNAEGATKKEVITPHLRFVWEVYRIILDICRHNGRLESLYKVIVERAFIFCHTYGRKAEFRRLSEMLRHHLSIIVKYPGQANGVSLSNPESHQLQLELRFQQLDVASKMELWHEAFRSIEDIHGLFVLARKSAKPALVRTYYENLARVFRQSDNNLYFAASLCKLFAMNKMHGADESGMKHEANLALLALTATPLLAEHDATNSMTPEETEAKNARLAAFLGLHKVPTRISIIKEMHTREMVNRADEDVRALFDLMECQETSSAETMIDVAAIGKLLTAIQGKADFASFIPAIYANVVCKVLQFISTQSSSVTISELEKKIKIDGLNIIFDLDAFLLKGCRSGDFSIRIDSIKGVLRFEKPCFAPRLTLDYSGDYRQNPIYKISVMINNLAAQISGEKKMTMANATSVDRSKIETMMKEAMAGLAAEHRANLGRKALIEKKKEMLEEAQQRKEREEARERALKLQAEREAEKARMAEEVARREALRREAEKEEIRKEQARRREEEEQRQKEAAARRANLEKMIAVVRRIDYLERAFREEELPLLHQDYDKQKKVDRDAYEDRVKVIRERSLAQHMADIKLKEDLKAMSDDYATYMSEVMVRREAAGRERMAEAQQALEEAKAARRQQVLAQAAQRKAEAERRQREEEERAAKLAADKARLDEEKAAYAEKQKELDRLAEIQRQKQAEVQARLSGASSTDSNAAAPAPAPASTSGKYVPPSRRQEVPAAAPSSDSRASAFGPRRTDGGSSSIFGSKKAPASDAPSDGKWRRS